jgi:hypothetical protein
VAAAAVLGAPVQQIVAFQILHKPESQEEQEFRLQ